MTPRENERITVIGCAGFIGSHLIDRLLAEGRYCVYGIDLVSEKIAHQLGNDRFTFVQGDIRDLETVRTLIERSPTVVLLAAICNPALYNTRTIEVIEANALDTIPVIRLCAKASSRLVYFSTSEVYGRTVASFTDAPDDPERYLLREEASPFILGPIGAERWSYACAKQLVERVIHAWGRERGLDYTVVRPFNFIGPRMDFLPGIDGEGIPRVLACFLSALMTGTPLKLVDGGKNRRCFTSINDAIDACMRIIERPAACRGRIFNIGNPANETTIEDLAHLMAGLWRTLVPGAAKQAITMENVSALDFYGPGYEDSDRRVPDIGKARKLLGWEPRVDLAGALRATIPACRELYRAMLPKR